MWLEDLVDVADGYRRAVNVNDVYAVQCVMVVWGIVEMVRS